MAGGNIVKETCEWVCSQAQHVKINDEAIHRVVSQLSHEDLARITSPKAFDQDLHYLDGGPLTTQYLLVVDALNFCFWPDPELEYEHLSKGVKARLQSDPSCLSAERLACMTGPDVRALLGWPRPLPQEEERARLMREVGQGLLAQYGGSAAQLVEAAGGSALRLLHLITQAFPGFRDHAVYRGRQVFFYKRAQIFIGDLHGAFQGAGLGAFHDIGCLTMFADYRVPVVLRVMGVLEYGGELEAQVASKQELLPGSPQELEIRAASVVAVERIKDAIHARFGPGSRIQQDPQQQTEVDPAVDPPALPLTIQLDWWLWHTGEEARQQHPPHHRTMTVYY